MSIHGYGYQPNLIFKTNVHDVYDYCTVMADEHLSVLPFVGFELEFERDEKVGHASLNKYAKKIKNNDLYCKEDGSLRCGFEVVSHPCTFDYWLLKHDWSWLDDMCSWGFSHATDGVSGEGGGMHFHINRKAFKNDSHIMEFENILLNTGWINDEGLTIDNYYAKREAQSIYAYNTGNYDKYKWVRPTEHTVEVRCFRGSVDKMRILFVMQVIGAIMNFAENEVC